MSVNVPKKTITVLASDRTSLDRLLDNAVAELRERTVECGILVTRYSDDTFVVALSAAVPFGLTKEVDARTPLDTRNFP